MVFPRSEIYQTVSYLSLLWVETWTLAVGLLFPSVPMSLCHRTGALGLCLFPCWTSAKQSKSLVVVLSLAGCAQSAGDVSSLTFQPFEQRVLGGGGLVL